MNKFIVLLFVGIMCLTFSGTTFAGYDKTYTYTPDDPDLGDLDHYKAYSWEIETGIGANETITGASLFFNDIRNWDNNDNILHVSLLDDADIASGVREYSDGQATSNYFDIAPYDGKLLFQMEDMNTTARDIEINITDLSESYDGSLKSSLPWLTQSQPISGDTIYMPVNGLTNLITYASDGMFGLGFDPDCHFYNNGITLTLHTTTSNGDPVPEPATLILFGAGLLCLASGLRKKN